MRPVKTVKFDSSTFENEDNDKVLKEAMLMNEIIDESGKVYVKQPQQMKGPRVSPHAVQSLRYGKGNVNEISREICEARSAKFNDTFGQRWERIKVKLDSGAVDWVFTPQAGEAVEVKPSFLSKRGINYTATNGTEMENYGQKMLSGFSDEWCPMSVNVQIADVKSNLAIGMRIVEAENRIVLDNGGSYIENEKTGNKIHIKHENGCFVFDMWVPAKNKEKPAQ